MDFSNGELKLIGEVQQQLRDYRRGLLNLTELIPALLHKAALADADRVIPHCLALLPIEARPHVETCVDRLVTSDYRENLVLYLGPGPSEEERAWLRLRNRAVAEKVVDHYQLLGDRADPPEGLAVPEVDLFWELLRGLRTDEGLTCQAARCDLPQVCVSVFCARHHYEQIEHRPPPDY